MEEWAWDIASFA
jgi:hypothetical protein